MASSCCPDLHVVTSKNCSVTGGKRRRDEWGARVYANDHPHPADPPPSLCAQYGDDTDRNQVEMHFFRLPVSQV